MNAVKTYESPAIDVLEIDLEHSVLLDNSVVDWENGSSYGGDI